MNNKEQEKIIESIDTTLTSLKELNDNQKEAKNADIIRMINYYIGMTNAMENRRQKIFDATVQYIVFLSAAIALLYSTTVDLPKEIVNPTLVFLVSQLVGSIRIIYVYYSQSSIKYPFLRFKYSNRWKWFYYGNEYIAKIDYDTRPDEDQIKNIETNYLRGLDYFINRYKTETINDELEDNIIHLYLLQVHNFYKNKFYSHLSSLRLNWLLLSFLGSFVWFIIQVASK